MIALSRLQIGLAAANAIAVAGLGWVVSTDVTSPKQVDGSSKSISLSAASSEPFSMSRLPIETYRKSVERPLFHPDRRALPERPTIRPAPVTAAAPIPAVPPLAVQLRGAIIATGKRIAILESGAGDTILRIAEGDQVQGWTLIRVEPKRAVFRAANQDHILDLKGSAEKPSVR